MPDHRTPDGDIEFLFDGDIPPRVPEGCQYELGFIRPETKWMFGNRQRLFLWFRILNPGEWFGRDLYMTCTVVADGKWRPSHKYFQAWVLAAGKRPNRRDRMSTAIFRNKVFRGKVRTVTKTSRQSLRTEEQQYSVIDELVGVLTGGDCQTCA